MLLSVFADLNAKRISEDIRVKQFSIDPNIFSIDGFLTRRKKDSFSRLCQALLFWRQSRKVRGETLEVWEGVRGASYPSQTPIFTLPIIRSFQAAETLAEDKLDLFKWINSN